MADFLLVFKLVAIEYLIPNKRINRKRCKAYSQGLYAFLIDLSEYILSVRLAFSLSLFFDLNDDLISERVK